MTKRDIYDGVHVQADSYDMSEQFSHIRGLLAIGWKMDIVLDPLGPRVAVSKSTKGRSMSLILLTRREKLHFEWSVAVAKPTYDRRDGEGKSATAAISAMRRASDELGAGVLL